MRLSAEPEAAAIESERERVSRIYGRYGTSDRRRRSWDASNPGNEAIRGELADRVLALVTPRVDEGRILDIGCGNGWWLRRLRHAGVPPARLAAIDVLPERVLNARAAVPGADIRVGDARQLPWEDGAFAGVTLFTLLSSLRTAADQRAGLQEAVRVTQPDGLVTIWEPRWPALRSPSRKLVRLRLREEAPDVDVHTETMTLLPPLARRLGRQTPVLYRALVRLPLLRSHRLVVLRRQPRAT